MSNSNYTAGCCNHSHVSSNASGVTFRGVLTFCLAVFLLGLSAVILTILYDSVMTRSDAVAVSFLYAFRVLLAFFVLYVGFRLYLSFEYQAIINERFKHDNVQVLPVGGGSGSGVDVGAVCEEYERLKAAGVFSWSKLCIAIYGKKSGHYVNELKQVLIEQGYELENSSPTRFVRVDN